MEAFTALRMARKHRFIIYSLSEDDATVTINAIGERQKTWDDFLALMPKDDCR